MSLQELWAADTLQVQEFMFNFLRDPLREIDEPYFSLDEVRHLGWVTGGREVLRGGGCIFAA